MAKKARENIGKFRENNGKFFRLSNSDPTLFGILIGALYDLWLSENVEKDKQKNNRLP